MQGLEASTAVLTWTGIEPAIIQPSDVACMNLARVPGQKPVNERLMQVFKVVVVAREEGHIINVQCGHTRSSGCRTKTQILKCAKTQSFR